MPRYSKQALKQIQEKIEAGKNCPHPPDRRQRIGFGIFCMDCQCRVALVGKAEGEKLILDALKNQAF